MKDETVRWVREDIGYLSGFISFGLSVPWKVTAEGFSNPEARPKIQITAATPPVVCSSKFYLVSQF